MATVRHESELLTPSEAATELRTTAATVKRWLRSGALPGIKAAERRVATIGRSEGVTPYLLRHTHASLLHYCGYTVPSAAARMGHAPTEHLSTYAHVIKALEGKPTRWADLDAAIAAARADLAAGRSMEAASR